MSLRLVSLMAENSDRHYSALAAYLTSRTGIRIEVVDEPPWWERRRLLESGGAEIGFVCGIVYARWADRRIAEFELLGAPVPEGARYGGRPAYFSDVLVRRESRFRTFGDLRGAGWAYNEPDSHSGYNVTRWHLARLGHGWDYFGRVVESGAHLRSLEMLLDGRVDACAIDSTVLELEMRARGELGQCLRRVHTLGPSPAPPGIIAASVPEPWRRALRAALLQIHHDPAGAGLLSSVQLRRYAAACDSTYDPIRRMAAVAETLAAPPRVSLA